jgi:hypothetical protein
MDEIIFIEPRKTFMEILRVHNREVPFANLLAFFFNPKEKHELNTLFIDALLETRFTHLGKNESVEISPRIPVYDANSIKVAVEVTTSEIIRIDILITSNTFTICIEFKINHDLNNPLDDYKKFVNDKYSNQQHYFFVLTPYKKEATGIAKEYFESNNEFKQIILRHFINKVKEKLQELYPNYENENIYFKYYFNDFIQTVENRKIHSKRHEVFRSLQQEINEKIKPIYCEFHKKGFLEIKILDFVLKIRIAASRWQIEKWITGEKPIILTSIKTYDEIINEVEKIISETSIKL